MLIASFVCFACGIAGRNGLSFWMSGALFALFTQDVARQTGSEIGQAEFEEKYGHWGTIKR